MENRINRFDVKIVTNRKSYLKWSFTPTLRREKQPDHGWIMIEKDKCEIKLNKPTHIEASILELSKITESLVKWKMKRETCGVHIKRLVGLNA